ATHSRKSGGKNIGVCRSTFTKRSAMEQLLTHPLTRSKVRQSRLACWRSRPRIADFTPKIVQRGQPPGTYDTALPDSSFRWTTGCQPVSFGSLPKLLQDSTDPSARTGVAGRLPATAG